MLSDLTTHIALIIISVYLLLAGEKQTADNREASPDNTTNNANLADIPGCNKLKLQPRKPQSSVKVQCFIPQLNVIVRVLDGSTFIWSWTDPRLLANA